jgi:hypothetical protein
MPSMCIHVCVSSSLFASDNPCHVMVILVQNASFRWAGSLPTIAEHYSGVDPSARLLDVGHLLSLIIHVLCVRSESGVFGTSSFLISVRRRKLNGNACTVFKLLVQCAPSMPRLRLVAQPSAARLRCNTWTRERIPLHVSCRHDSVSVHGIIRTLGLGPTRARLPKGTSRSAQARLRMGS